jgi:chromosome segregation ATPase
MEYISVADFAEAAGVTPQAVYKRIKGDLATFVKVEGNTKTISTEALQFFKIEKPVDRSEEIEALQAEVERLTSELTVKQQEINNLNTHIRELSQKLVEILAKQTEQAENYQKLIAANMQLQQQLLNPPQPVEEEQPVEESCEEVVQQVNKQGFFSKLFRR